MAVSLNQSLPEAQDTQQTLPGDHETQSSGFTIIPNHILRARNLSRDAKLLYSILRSYAWQKDTCFPSYETLMADMQCSSQALSSYIKELIEHGLIAVQRRGQGKTSLYIITDTATPAAGGRRQETEQEQSCSLKIKEQELRKSKTEEYSSKEYKDGYPSSDRKTENGGEDYVKLTGAAAPRQDSTAIPHQTSGEQYTNNSRTTHRNIETIERSKNIASAREKRLDMYDDIQRGLILEYISDFAQEFHDQAPLTSSTTRAYNLFRQSGVSMETFVDYLYSARLTTKERSAYIRKQTEYGLKTKMAYFFAVLEDRLGLRQAGRTFTT